MTRDAPGTQQTKRSLAVYVHIPFCVRKCAYCDFLSFPLADLSREGDVQRRYFHALCKEISAVAPSVRDCEVRSIYFGGGTPSLAETKYIVSILERLAGCFNIAGDAEISLECNPGTADQEKLCLMRRAGVNRLSIGVQSLHDEQLALLGRIHTAAEAIRCYTYARSAGFDNVNLDMMAALPGQTGKLLIEDISRALDLRPEHISLYSLIIEEGTPFYERYADQVPDPHYDRSASGDGKRRCPGPKGKSGRQERGAAGDARLPSEEEERDMLHAAWEALASAGFERYEISNAARCDRKRDLRCKQNMIYWTRGDYLGLGLGACSLIRETRFSNTRRLRRYLRVLGETDPGEPMTDSAGKPAADDPSDLPVLIRENMEQLSVREQMEEFMFLGLRLTAGVSEEHFAECFHCRPDEVYGEVIRRHERDGLLVRREGRILLTERGMDLANYVMAEFLLPQKENSAMI